MPSEIIMNLPYKKPALIWNIYEEGDQLFLKTFSAARWPCRILRDDNSILPSFYRQLGKIPYTRPYEQPKSWQHVIFFTSILVNTKIHICGNLTRPNHIPWTFIMWRETTTVRELLLTDVTLERFWTGVRPVVTCQVVWPAKLPAASFPCALVRLSSVDLLVRIQCAFPLVYLVAAGKVTGMCLPDLQALHGVWI